ncbi:uncharacterized protein LOC131328551 [Rhododendron vialii]|uniref:uncharacterized protein LOC131328551 n=1 Tax=Rhododendron vialii TaxID=182163 RepID=UPI00265E498F|nr:uncharacterized protein LOC131328551 [Rhododendron vialii]
MLLSCHIKINPRAQPPLSPSLSRRRLGASPENFIAELLRPVGLLLLPIGLLLVIVFLSSDAGSAISGLFSTGKHNSIHRVSGSPVGVALFLVLILFLLYNRVSIFRGDNGSDE